MSGDWGAGGAARESRFLKLRSLCFGIRGSGGREDPGPPDSKGVGAWWLAVNVQLVVSKL